MAGLTSVREVLAAGVAHLVDQNAFAYMPDHVPVGSSGAAVVGVDPGARVIERLTLDRTVQYAVFVRVYVRAVSDEAGQRQLDALVSRTGERSLWQAIEDLPGNGEFEYAQVAGVSNYGESTAPQDGTRYLSADLEVIAVESTS